MSQNITTPLSSGMQAWDAIFNDNLDRIEDVLATNISPFKDLYTTPKRGALALVNSHGSATSVASRLLDITIPAGKLTAPAIIKCTVFVDGSVLLNDVLNVTLHFAGTSYLRAFAISESGFVEFLLYLHSSTDFWIKTSLDVAAAAPTRAHTLAQVWDAAVASALYVEVECADVADSAVVTLFGELVQPS